MGTHHRASDSVEQSDAEEQLAMDTAYPLKMSSLPSDTASFSLQSRESRSQSQMAEQSQQALTSYDDYIVPVLRNNDGVPQDDRSPMYRGGMILQRNPWATEASMQKSVTQRYVEIQTSRKTEQDWKQEPSASPRTVTKKQSDRATKLARQLQRGEIALKITKAKVDELKAKLDDSQQLLVSAGADRPETSGRTAANGPHEATVQAAEATEVANALYSQTRGRIIPNAAHAFGFIMGTAVYGRRDTRMSEDDIRQISLSVHAPEPADDDMADHGGSASDKSWKLDAVIRKGLTAEVRHRREIERLAALLHQKERELGIARKGKPGRQRVGEETNPVTSQRSDYDMVIVLPKCRKSYRRNGRLVYRPIEAKEADFSQ